MVCKILNSFSCFVFLLSGRSCFTNLFKFPLTITCLG
uniref:Uncharacterized protein n=1 Tax=Arundo donax TaxID=35708 RepID=A0A0A9HDJ6_ARUDO